MTMTSCVLHVEAGLCDFIVCSLYSMTSGEEGYTMVQPGRYRHYKGQEYEVLGVARHSETEEEYVVYRAHYGTRGLWIRPTAMFLETVIVDGRSCPRFQFLAVS